MSDLRVLLSGRVGSQMLQALASVSSTKKTFMLPSLCTCFKWLS